jgi:hypothetical protein
MIFIASATVAFTAVLEPMQYSMSELIVLGTADFPTPESHVNTRLPKEQAFAMPFVASAQDYPLLV